jgi:protein SCO1/2
MQMRSGLIVGMALGLILVVGLGMIFLSGPYQYQGSLIDPPVQAVDFTLIDQQGQSFKLSEQRGSTVLIFFGYTHCPDICPTTLAEYQEILTGLKDQASKVRFVFITVDPERDTPEQLAEYIEFFNPSFVGLTEERKNLEPVWKAYGVYQQKQDVGSAAGYLVDHSTRMYVVDPKGNLVLTYPFGFETQKIIDDLVHLVKAQ